MIATLNRRGYNYEAKALAGQLPQAKAVPAPYPEDALHIAIVAVNGIDIILSLNFKHINNPLQFGKFAKPSNQWAINARKYARQSN